MFLPGLVNERADEAGADAVALMIGEELDAGEVDLAGAVFDVDHADVVPPAVMICQRCGLKAQVWKSRWTCSSHPQIAAM